MDLRVPDRLTFKRSEVIKITRLDGKVLDYWETEFGGLKPTVNKLGEKFYARQDVEIILKIKQMLIVEKRDKTEIKKTIGDNPGVRGEPGEAGHISLKTGGNNRNTLRIIKNGLQEILTILDKNDK